MSKTISEELNEIIRHDWQIAIVASASEEDLLALLGIEINRLIQENFSWLIHLLYRMDIPEKKLRNLLSENKQADAGRIIAHLIIERQKQKIQYKKEHPPGNYEIDEEEKW